MHPITFDLVCNCLTKNRLYSVHFSKVPAFFSYRTLLRAIQVFSDKIAEISFQKCLLKCAENISRSPKLYNCWDFEFPKDPISFFRDNVHLVFTLKSSIISTSVFVDLTFKVTTRIHTLLVGNYSTR